jgi:hypothetical protein
MEAGQKKQNVGMSLEENKNCLESTPNAVTKTIGAGKIKPLCNYMGNILRGCRLSS